MIELQLKSFQRFIDSELTNLVQSYFPVKSPNGRYSIEFERLWLGEPKRSEVKSRYEGKNYEAPINVELVIVDNETGERKKARKNAANNTNSVFLGALPLMNKKGTFVINGVEKVVIAQIVRSSGLYVLPKVQVRLNNSRKKQLKGLIAEFLPMRGTYMVLNIPENKDTIQLVAKDSTGETAKTFEVTTFLKAIGISEATIKTLFANVSQITTSLVSDGYSIDAILKDNEINQMIQSGKLSAKALQNDTSIDGHLRRLVYKLSNLSDAEKVSEAGRLIVEQIICERASKELVQELSISTKSLEAELTSEQSINYQSLVWHHFFTARKYDVADAGRYKINRKLRVSERIYGKILAVDIKDSDGKVVIAKETLLAKEQIDLLKKLVLEGKNLDIFKTVKLVNTISLKTAKAAQPSTTIEVVSVYENNESKDSIIDIIGCDANNKSTSLAISDIVATVSYICQINKNIGTFDDIDHLGNKRIKLIHELLRAQCASGLVKIEKFIKEKLAIADWCEQKYSIVRRSAKEFNAEIYYQH